MFENYFSDESTSSPSSSFPCSISFFSVLLAFPSFCPLPEVKKGEEGLEEEWRKSFSHLLKDKLRGLTKSQRDRDRNERAFHATAQFFAIEGGSRRPEKNPYNSEGNEEEMLKRKLEWLILPSGLQAVRNIVQCACITNMLQMKLNLHDF